MRHFDLWKTLLIALYGSSTKALIHDGHRVLRAATRRADLLGRDSRITQKFKSDVVYVEGGRSPFPMLHRADTEDKMSGDKAPQCSHRQSRLLPRSLYCISKKSSTSSRMFDVKTGGCCYVLSMQTLHKMQELLAMADTEAQEGSLSHRIRAVTETASGLCTSMLTVCSKYAREY